MTEKRFSYGYGKYKGILFLKMIDNNMHTFYFIEDSEENVKIFCNRLNWLVDENRQLKKFKENVFDEIGKELHYLKEKSNDNPVNRGRIRALEDLERRLLL